MFRKPPPTAFEPVSLADALTVSFKVGLGKSNGMHWRSRDDLQNALDYDAASKNPKPILNNDERFTAKAFSNAAAGRSKASRIIGAVIKFITNGEDEDWVGFLERAYDYSASFPQNQQPRMDEERVKRILLAMRTQTPRAIGFRHGEGMTDYLSINVEPSKKSARNLVLDQPASIEFFSAGLYCERETVTGPASQALESFLLRHTNAGAPTIFWLDGRSGDGKSTVLLQLPEILKHRVEHSFIHVRDLETLGRLDISDPRFYGKRLVLVVDDLAKLVKVDVYGDDPLTRQLGLFELAIANGTIKTISIVTCGPTPEMQFFRSEFSEIKLENHPVPPLEEGEFGRFAEWFALNDVPEATGEVDLLVEYLFTLSVGMTLRKFAHAFRERIEGIFGLYTEVKKIITASSFELPTPVVLFENAKVPIGIRRLSEDDQRHFHADNSADPKGLFFSHNAISKTLLRHWIREPSSTDTLIQLAQAIGDLLSECPNEVYAFKFTERLRLHPRHAQEICDDDGLQPIAVLSSIRDALPPSSHSLITTTAAMATLVANERNQISAGTMLKSISVENAVSTEFRSTSCILLMKLAELADITNDAANFDLADRCVDTLLNGPMRSEAGYAVGHLVTRKIAPPNLVEKWFFMNPEGDRPPELICAAHRTPITLREANLWLKDHGKEQQSVKVGAWLIKGTLSSKEAMSLVGPWLFDNIGLNGQYGIIATLLRSFPIDDELFQFSLFWFQKNKLMPGAESVLAQLIRKSPVSHLLVGTLIDFVRETVRVHGAKDAARNRIAPPLIAALERWPKHQKMLQKCAVKFIELFPASDHANQVFGQLVKTTRKSQQFVSNEMLRHFAQHLCSSGFECQFMAAHLPTYVKFFDFNEEIMAKAYEWLAAAPYRAKGRGVATTLLAANWVDTEQANTIWMWIDEFKDQRSIHDALIRYFEKFHRRPEQRAKVIEWARSNKDRFGAAYLWSHISRHYPEYRIELGDWDVDRNRVYLDFPKIEQDKMWFQVLPGDETARALERSIRADLENPSSVNAVEVLLKGEVEGFDPFPVALDVIRVNLGSSRPINLVTKLANSRAIPAELSEGISKWLLGQRETKGVGAPLIACLDAGVVEIEDCFDWAIPSIQNDPGVFGLHLDPLVERLAGASGMIALPSHSILRLASAMHISSSRSRFLSRIVAQKPERCEELIGKVNSPEVISLWKSVLEWEKPPENVINAFFDWCNDLNRIGSEYKLANVISGGPRPDWLKIERIDEPARSLIH